MKSYIIVVSLASALVLSSSMWAQSASTPSAAFADLNWSTNATGSIAQNPPQKAAIQAFVSSQLNTDGTEQVNVCSSAFFDLTGNGQFSLVASLDQTGRYFCNELAVFSKTNTGIQVQEVPAWNANDVAQLIRRLGSAGSKLLVVPQAYSQYQGAKCMATIDKIYSLQNGVLSDVSASHASYYKQELASLDSQIAAKSKGSDLSCKQMEADKLERMLGLSTDAGFAQAVLWSESSDADIRSKGVTVLADIGNTASLNQLKTMVNDPSPSVALQAKQAVGQN